MEITRNMKLTLTNMIVEDLKNNFKEIYVTHNLIDTITVDILGSGNIKISIPAKIYDAKLWRDEKMIAYTGQGSYAQEVNVIGGYSGKHKNYIEEAIKKSIVKWLNYYHIADGGTTL
jgi:hypothetical protein